MMNEYTNPMDMDTQVAVPTKNLEGARYVFCVLDLIDHQTKASNPEWKLLGGVLRPEARCLKWNSGYIPRCEITELKPLPDSFPRGMVHPEKRETLAPVVEMAAVNAATGQFEQKTIGVIERGERAGQHDGLLRKIFYPVQEIGRLAGQIDGVVEMPVANNREKNLAQAFLFPNWNLIKTGNAPMPPNVQILKAHFERLRAGLTPENPHYRLFMGVVNAAINSCENAFTWADNLINGTEGANSEWDKAKVKGHSWGFGSQVRKASEQLGITLRDTAAQAQDNTLKEMASAVKTLAEIQVQQLRNAPQNAPTLPVPVSSEENAKQVMTPFESELAEKEATPKAGEAENAEDAPVWAVGRQVLTNGRQAEILELKPGGNLKVQFADGEKEITGVNRKNCELIG